MYLHRVIAGFFGTNSGFGECFDNCFEILDFHFIDNQLCILIITPLTSMCQLTNDFDFTVDTLDEINNFFVMLDHIIIVNAKLWVIRMTSQLHKRMFHYEQPYTSFC